MYDKKNDFVYIKTLKLILDYRNNTRKRYRVFKPNQEAWLTPYISMNTKLRLKIKNYFEKGFFKIKNRSVFRKAMRNVRNRSDIKFLTAEKRSSNFISQPNYNTTKNFSEKLLVI